MAAPMRPLMDSLAHGLRRWCEPELQAVVEQLRAEGRDTATLSLELETPEDVYRVRVVIYREGK